VFLKSLEIFGFKSFADRTRVEFADGITALLGPNGCGKSNVVDAIKWVVGEQAAKSLRAERMEDVIFNGTESRKPVNVAEVSIIISNEKNILAMDMPEISIKRRLYRSGESEYYINDVQVKLKDVRELFWDTGVGKSAYSVMEQGKIDQILSSKPEERRYLFEEAAGITRHKLRSREAETKLSQTEENMHKADLLLAEVKRSYETLKVQCEKTLKYRGLKDESFQIELDINLLRLKNFNTEFDRRSESIAKAEKDRDSVRAEIDAINRNLEENLDLVNSLEAKVADFQKTIYGLAVEKTGKEKHRKLIQERISEAKAKIDQAGLKHKAAREKLEGLIEDRDDKQVALRDLKTRVVDIEKNAREFEERIKEASDRIKGNEEEVKSQESRILNLEAEEARLRKDLEAITDDIVSELDKRLKDSGYSSQARRTAESVLSESIAGLKVMMEGRFGLFSDYLRSPGSADELRGYLERARDTAKEALEKAGKIQEQFEAFRKTSPAFLDEFLSPEGIITKKRAIDASIAGVKNGIDACRAQVRDLREENRQLGAKVDEYRATLEELRLNLMRMRTQISGEEDSVRMLDREIQGQEVLSREIQEEIQTEERRLAVSKEELSDIDEELADIDKRGREITVELTTLEKDISNRNSDVTSRQDEVKKKVQRLGAIQTDLERYHLDRAQMETEIRNLEENFRESHSRDLLEFEERMFDIHEQPAVLREKISVVRNSLRDLGSVNFMAPEEFAEVKERYEFLSGQLDDLKKAREDLFRITSEIRTESTELFLATYNKIKKNFHNMFRRLFGGGQAELRLDDTEHVLESGIDIYARPPGKKLENITLLSGGEKSMTAVALLFATYMVKPSPFCFLDEIDAALDEQNVLRFIQVLREFGRTSQFVIITHNKKTVTGAGTLLGVTMQESGITKVIAVRLENKKDQPIEPVSPADSFLEEDVEYEHGTELPTEAELEYAKRQKKRERAVARAAKATAEGRVSSDEEAEAADEEEPAVGEAEPARDGEPPAEAETQAPDEDATDTDAREGADDADAPEDSDAGQTAPAEFGQNDEALVAEAESPSEDAGKKRLPEN
jgi:chromosome segregation protein